LRAIHTPSTNRRAAYRMKNELIAATNNDLFFLNK